MTLVPEVSAGRQVLAYVSAIVAAFATSSLMYHLFTLWRRADPIRRYIARFCITSSFAWAFGVTEVLIAGPYWAAGPTRFGGYRSAPETGADILRFAVIVGVGCATFWPFLRWLSRSELEM